MTETLQAITNIAVFVFVALTLLSMGLELKLREVISTLRNPRLVVCSLLVNFVVAPLLAWGIARMFALKQPHATGLLLLGCAAGAPFLPKLAALARGDMAFSVALMLLLTIGSVAFLPVALPLLIPGVQIDPWNIARSLLLSMLVPLAAGMILSRILPVMSVRLHPWIRRLSNLSLIVALALIIFVNAQAMIGTFGSGASVASILFVAVTILLGYLLGGPREETKSVLGLGSGQRNIAAGLVIATENFTDPEVTLMLIITTLVGLVPLLAVIFFLRRRSASLIPQTTS